MPSKTRHLTFKLDQSLYDDIREIADSLGYSMAEVVRAFCEHGVEEMQRTAREAEQRMKYRKSLRDQLLAVGWDESKANKIPEMTDEEFGRTIAELVVELGPERFGEIVEVAKGAASA